MKKVIWILTFMLICMCIMITPARADALWMQAVLKGTHPDTGVVLMYKQMYVYLVSVSAILFTSLSLVLWNEW